MSLRHYNERITEMGKALEEKERARVKLRDTELKRHKELYFKNRKDEADQAKVAADFKRTHEHLRKLGSNGKAVAG